MNLNSKEILNEIFFAVQLQNLPMASFEVELTKGAPSPCK